MVYRELFEEAQCVSTQTNASFLFRFHVSVYLTCRYITTVSA